MTSDEFEAVHERLTAILEAHATDGLVITKNGPTGMALEVQGLEGKPWGYVAGTRVGKSYVSFYLMPAYVSREIAASLSPELRKRMQGKSCFNFRRIDENLFRELSEVAARSIPGFREQAEALAATRSSR